MSSRKQRAACAALVPLVLAMAAFGMARAADWPTRSVTVVVPYAAGGNTDMMARLLTKRLAERLGQPFVIENRPGGAGSIGAIQVARATPDGNTLMFGASSQIINVPMLQKVSYDPDKDFVPVSIFGAGPYLLGIKSALPVKTLSDFVAYAKSNPGKLNYASAGHGGNVHLNTALFLARAGLDMVHVPYKSGAPAMNGLAAGEIEMYFGNASELIQHASNDRIRLLAVSTMRRLSQLPDVPTVAELYPGFDTSSWNGLFAPAGTPQAIIDVLVNEVIGAAKDPEIVERLERLAILPFGTTQAEFVAIINRSRVSIRDAIRAAGVKPD